MPLFTATSYVFRPITTVSTVFQNADVSALTSSLHVSQSTAWSARAIKLSRLLATPKVTLRGAAPGGMSWEDMKTPPWWEATTNPRRNDLRDALGFPADARQELGGEVGA